MRPYADARGDGSANHVRHMRIHLPRSRSARDATRGAIEFDAILMRYYLTFENVNSRFQIMTPVFDIRWRGLTFPMDRYSSS
jgi:hypothetical protein